MCSSDFLIWHTPQLVCAALSYVEEGPGPGHPAFDGPRTTSMAAAEESEAKAAGGGAQAGGKGAVTPVQAAAGEGGDWSVKGARGGSIVAEGGSEYSEQGERVERDGGFGQGQVWAQAWGQRRERGHQVQRSRGRILVMHEPAATPVATHSHTHTHNPVQLTTWFKSSWQA